MKGNLATSDIWIDILFVLQTVYDLDLCGHFLAQSKINTISDKRADNHEILMQREKAAQTIAMLGVAALSSCIRCLNDAHDSLENILWSLLRASHKQSTPQRSNAKPHHSVGRTTPHETSPYHTTPHHCTHVPTSWIVWKLVGARTTVTSDCFLGPANLRVL
jgi:hypothetical protein